MNDNQESLVNIIAQLRNHVEILEAKLHLISVAMHDAGPHPDYHARQVHRLRQEWPTLSKALDLAVGAYDDGWKNSTR